jgi:uncharacterized protein YbjQ (UPF0145 family)
MIITTTNRVEGYQIIEYLDIVFQESIIGVGIGTSLKSFGDIFKGWTGEKFEAISNRIEEVKQIVKNALIDSALKLGADAIVGVDIETTRNANDGTIGVSMSGTAVKLRVK